MRCYPCRVLSQRKKNRSSSSAVSPFMARATRNGPRCLSLEPSRKELHLMLPRFQWMTSQSLRPASQLQTASRSGHSSFHHRYKVQEHSAAFTCQDRLRMELNALYKVLLVPDAHYLAVIQCFCSNFKVGRN